MSIPYSTAELQRFIGTFYRTNAKRPPQKPDFVPQGRLDNFVITKGMLQFTLGEQKVDIAIPPHEQVDDTTYQGLVELLVQDLVRLFGALELTGHIRSAMQNSGLVARGVNGRLIINPLTAGYGEQDVFYMPWV